MIEAISVAATVLNEAADIDELVASLVGQVPAPAEVILVDGGSTDGTWERLLHAAACRANVIAIRDETCSLRESPGPIARGRNVAIAAASSMVIACADAGCTYGPDWLARLTGPIVEGAAEYSLGGSCLEGARATLWDLASAPFFGVKLSVAEPTKSCTARSMAFRKTLWQRVGGFPETVFLGEDTLFDARVRRLVAPSFPEGAKAFYHPRHSFRSAVRQLASYAATDGILGVRPARLVRNFARCFAEVLGVLAVGFTVVPLVLVLALEIYFAFRLDWRDIRSKPARVLAGRLLFSLLVPWVVTWHQVRAHLTKASLPNRQNAG